MEDFFSFSDDNAAGKFVCRNDISDVCNGFVIDGDSALFDETSGFGLTRHKFTKLQEFGDHNAVCLIR